MSKREKRPLGKLARRVQRLEDRHRRDVVALKADMLRAMWRMLDERLPVEIDA